MSKVAVLGTTSWGTTLAVLLARNGVETLLVCRTESEVRNMVASGENRRHRPALLFPEGLMPTADLAELSNVDALLIAVPSVTLQESVERVLPALSPGSTVVSATKGIDVKTGARVSEMIASLGVDPSRIAALSGPNFAVEIAN